MFIQCVVLCAEDGTKKGGGGCVFQHALQVGEISSESLKSIRRSEEVEGEGEAWNQCVSVDWMIKGEEKRMYQKKKKTKKYPLIQKKVIIKGGILGDE